MESWKQQKLVMHCTIFLDIWNNVASNDAIVSSLRFAMIRCLIWFFVQWEIPLTWCNLQYLTISLRFIRSKQFINTSSSNLPLRVVNASFMIAVFTLMIRQITWNLMWCFIDVCCTNVFGLYPLACYAHFEAPSGQISHRPRIMHY